MHQIIIKEIKFGSFIKISICMSIAVGVIFGGLMFILSLFGGAVRANLGSTVLTGLAGGIASLLIAPLTFLLFGIMGGLFGYLPFKWLLKVMKGISIYGKYEAVSTYVQAISKGRKLNR